MFDYKLIEAMAMVAREGGFDKAARALHITQSAVSQRVKLLEEYTGQILIVRTTPPRTTSAGRQLLKHYLQVKRLEDDLTGETNKLAGKWATPLAVGLNADSLATWFPDAIRPFIHKESVLLDIRVDDQEQTHRLLKDGDVVGCISTRNQPLQGCRIDYIGQMIYHMLATPEFADRWFPNGLALADVYSAPAIVFNRKDGLHHKLLQQAFGVVPDPIPTSYVPSSEKFADFITMGFGYGMLPLQQSEPFTRAGRLVDLAPDLRVPVNLYWHCWNLRSTLLEKLSRHLILSTKTILNGPSGTFRGNPI